MEVTFVCTQGARPIFLNSVTIRSTIIESRRHHHCHHPQGLVLQKVLHPLEQHKNWQLLSWNPAMAVSPQFSYPQRGRVNQGHGRTRAYSHLCQYKMRSRWFRCPNRTHTRMPSRLNTTTKRWQGEARLGLICPVFCQCLTK